MFSIAVVNDEPKTLIGANKAGTSQVGEGAREAKVSVSVEPIIIPFSS